MYQINKMSITHESELIGMQKVSEAVAFTLKEMCGFAKPGMTTKEVDDFGAAVLKSFGDYFGRFRRSIRECFGSSRDQFRRCIWERFGGACGQVSEVHLGRFRRPGVFVILIRLILLACFVEHISKS